MTIRCLELSLPSVKDNWKAIRLVPQELLEARRAHCTKVIKSRLVTAL